MAKKDLFCIKTNKGYGLFQEFDSYPNWLHYIFYIVYYTQVEKLSEEEIMKSLHGEYYYQRIGFNVWDKKFSKEKFLDNPKIEFGAKDFGINESSPFYGKCYITYLGEYDLPSNVELPKFSRELDLSKITGKHKWFLYNEMRDCLAENERGNFISYKTVKEEIKSYPRYYVTSPMEILKRFNAEYRQCNDDEWEDMKMEEYYQENPDMRPTKLKYEEVKFPLPTEEMRQLNKDNDNVNERERYEDFCDKVEALCMAFLNGIEQDKKSTRKHLITIVEVLNQLNDETGLIETMEAEIIYMYLANILKSLKKFSLIEIIEDRRTW